MQEAERQRFGHECIYYGNQAGLYLEVVGETSEACGRTVTLQVTDFSRGDFESRKRYRLNSHDLRKIAKMLDEAADKADGAEDTSENSISYQDDETEQLHYWDRWS
jgi:hypothetical protein